MIIDKLDYPVFEEDWNLMDETKFITGLEKCGIDNWVTLCSQMNDSKNIFSHFYTFFYDITKLATQSGEDPISFSKIDNVDESKLLKIANDSFVKSCILYANSTVTWDYLNLNKFPGDRYEKVLANQILNLVLPILN
jgi:hypothetical protein